eukprot:3128532-Pyramimonas_sp.AAC.3
MLALAPVERAQGTDAVAGVRRGSLAEASAALSRSGHPPLRAARARAQLRPDKFAGHRASQRRPGEGGPRRASAPGAWARARRLRREGRGPHRLGPRGSDLVLGPLGGSIGLRLLGLAALPVDSTAASRQDSDATSPEGGGPPSMSALSGPST